MATCTKAGRLPLSTVLSGAGAFWPLACVPGAAVAGKAAGGVGPGISQIEKWHCRIRGLIPRGESRQVKRCLDGRRNRAVVVKAMIDDIFSNIGCRGFRAYWHWKYRHLGGRPRTAAGIRALILRMNRETRCGVHLAYTAND